MPFKNGEPLLRVAAYCRVSTDKEDQLNSLAAQQQFFRSYVTEHPGWSLADIFADGPVKIGLRAYPRIRRVQIAQQIFC